MTDNLKIAEEAQSILGPHDAMAKIMAVALWSKVCRFEREEFMEWCTKAYAASEEIHQILNIRSIQ